MPTFLEISVNVPQVSGIFHYHLPAELEGRVGPGHLVQVPFGKQAVQGVVLKVVETPAVRDTKPVTALIDPDPVVTPAQIALACRLSDQFLTPLAACMDLMLPPGVAQQADVLYTLNPVTGPSILSSGERYYELSEIQNRIINLLKERGSLRGRQIDSTLTRVEWRPAALALVKRGFINSAPLLPPPSIQPKSIRTALLGVPPEQAQAAMPSLGKSKSEAFRRRQAVLLALMDKAEPVEVAWIYAESGGRLEDLKYLSERGLVILSESEVWRDPLSGIEVSPTQALQLTGDQAAALAEISASIHKACEGQEEPPFLLHGVTGSGKTEIYLQAVQQVIEMGRQAIVLVPEIALTPQTVRRFIGRFPGRVGLVHSRLSAGEQYDTWRRARQGLLSVIVGPRSALFSPCPNLGLIVLDEAHDDSYYQSDFEPHYDARTAAEAYAQLAGAACIFGTATPAISLRYRAQREHWRVLKLPERILAHKQVIRAQEEKLGAPSSYRQLEGDAETIDLPPVSIVDMRSELKEGNRSIFSRLLLDCLESVLDRKQQAILYLNRRGTATYIFCRQCGHTLKCPQCELPLTLHITKTQPVLVSTPASDLRCHYCGYTRKAPARCPECNSNAIRQFGAGTEGVEAQIQKIFPHARTLRWDYETTRKKGAHEIILSHFANHHADILIGTQMIAKGLDLPMVTLVGLVLADVGLSLPDYRAPERTFQLLTQVSGRAGRSPLGGRVVLQTFQPEHYVIQAAARHDYESFYQQELDHRRHLGYPPFSRMVRLEYRSYDSFKAESAARSLASVLEVKIQQENRRITEIIGPAPCFFEKIGGNYRWHLILRGPDPSSMLTDLKLKDWHIEIDPISLL